VKTIYTFWSADCIDVEWLYKEDSYRSFIDKIKIRKIYY